MGEVGTHGSLSLPGTLGYSSAYTALHHEGRRRRFRIMHHRAFRLFSLLILFSLLASSVPPAITQAIPLRPEPSTLQSTPAVLDDTATGRVPAVPTAAGSTPLPASYAETVATQVEGSHTLQTEPIDGTFESGDRVPTASYPGSLGQGAGYGNGSALGIVKTLSVPPGYHDSFDVTATVIGAFVDVGAVVEVKPASAAWGSSTHKRIVIASNRNSSVTVRKHLTVQTTAPFTEGLDIRFRCEATTGSFAGNCAFSDLQFYRDTPRWTHLLNSDFSTAITYVSDPDLQDTDVQITHAPVGAINPDQGGYLAFDFHRGTAQRFHYYGSEFFRMPALKTNDVLTATLRWQVSAAPTETEFSTINVRLLTTKGTVNRVTDLLTTSETEAAASQSWATKQGTGITLTASGANSAVDRSEAVGRIVLM